MVSFIFPSGNRLCVHFPTLIPEISQNTIKQCIEEKGFVFTKVDIIQLAYEQIGKAYKRGSVSLSNDMFDCSSLMQWLYSQLGVYIPRISIDQREYGQRVEISDLKLGDLVFTSGAINYYRSDKKDSVGHVGIFTGKSVIHAANKTRGVVEDSFECFVKENYRGSTRFIENISETDTLILPKKINVEYDMHLRWKILCWFNSKA